MNKFTSAIVAIFMLTSCSPYSLVDLQRASPSQRAQMVCIYSKNWQDAKDNHDRARKQKNIWQTDANNGYETKRQCKTIQEPYHEDVRRCVSDGYNRVCYDETVTKYRSRKQCHNVYVPINVEAAQRTADEWAHKQTNFAQAMEKAWNECYAWAVRENPEVLHNWLP